MLEPSSMDCLQVLTSKANDFPRYQGADSSKPQSNPEDACCKAYQEERMICVLQKSIIVAVSANGASVTGGHSTVCRNRSIDFKVRVAVLCVQRTSKGQYVIWTDTSILATI